MTIPNAPIIRRNVSPGSSHGCISNAKVVTIIMSMLSLVCATVANFPHFSHFPEVQWLSLCVTTAMLATLRCHPMASTAIRNISLALLISLCLFPYSCLSVGSATWRVRTMSCNPGIRHNIWLSKSQLKG